MRGRRPRFAADEMLGSLARWLRIMGYDTTYQKDMADEEILRHAREEGRVLLSRDRELVGRAGESGMYVESDDPTAQLRQVFSAFSLTADERLTRCTVCNGDLETVDVSEVRDSVPPGVLENNDEFFRCVRCHKIYWKGTHWNRIMRTLEGLSDEGTGSGRDTSNQSL